MSFANEWKRVLVCDPKHGPHTVMGRTVCLAAHPGRVVLFPFVRWFEKKYLGRFRFPRLAFAADLFGAGLIVGLLATGVIFSLYKPSDFGERVVFDADVAPHEVVAGDSSTLIIRYRNETGEDLRQAKLTLGFPAHFLLQDLSSDLSNPVGHNTFDVGTVPAGAEGSVKIRGVMFGDVGGKQTFRSILTFVHGKNDEPGQKIDFHSFTPSHSALELSLAPLPAKIYAGQIVPFTLAYKNAGPVDFPDVRIALSTAGPLAFGASPTIGSRYADDLGPVKAGQSGTWAYQLSVTATAGAAQPTLEIDPSFTFADANYRQVPLVTAIPVLAPPLRVSHTMNDLRPGMTADVTVSYQNTGDVALLNASVGIETDSPLFAWHSFTVDAKTDKRLARIEPGASGTVTVHAPAGAGIQASDLSPDGTFRVVTRAYASYRLADGNVPLVSRGADLSTIPTSPFILSAVGHYAAPSGDQLGRGPLPPVVGEQTTYWIFWNLRGTINPAKNLRVEGRLPAGVEFTGRQTVSQGDPIAYDDATRTVSWAPGSVDPTLPPGSKTAGGAFEVGLTPTPAQANTAPVLITNLSATATDATTGDVLAASARPVTTDLPQDPLAAGNGIVTP